MLLVLLKRLCNGVSEQFREKVNEGRDDSKHTVVKWLDECFVLILEIEDSSAYDPVD